MPKPFSEHAGSAMHTHMSLFEGDTNAFHNPDDPMQLSATGKAFIAGILEHADEISAVTNQWVNSYKRLVHGGEAPTAACWGPSNRSALDPCADVHAEQGVVASRRDPQPRLGVQPVPDVRGAARGRSARHREGLRTPARGRGRRVVADVRRASGHGLQGAARRVSTSALREMEKSELVAEALGEHVFDFFLRNKRREWENYRSQVTPFELKKYLGL